MTNWYVAHDSRETTPPTIEDNISSSTVYERRNVQKETVDDGMGGTITQWTYEQREYTKAEYQMMQLLTDSLSNNGIGQLRADVDYIAVMNGIDLV